MPKRLGKPSANLFRLNRIRSWRKAKGLTLAELASRVGCSVPHLSNVERMRGALMPAFAESLAQALEIDVDTLWNREPSAKPSSEQTLIGLFRQADEAQQRRIIRVVREMTIDPDETPDA